MLIPGFVVLWDLTPCWAFQQLVFKNIEENIGPGRVYTGDNYMAALFLGLGRVPRPTGKVKNITRL